MSNTIRVTIEDTREGFLTKNETKVFECKSIIGSVVESSEPSADNEDNDVVSTVSIVVGDFDFQELMCTTSTFLNGLRSVLRKANEDSNYPFSEEVVHAFVAMALTEESISTEVVGNS